MKKLLFVMIGAVLVLGACGGANEEPEVNETPTNEETPANDETAAGDFDAAAAESTYQSSCIGCHGGNLEGGVGPALAGTALTEEEMVAIIHAGVEGTAMSPFPDVDAENLAAWIATQ